MGHKHVIVIGSGVSGLACARELVQRGYEVLVVEARSRVGGRLKGESLQLQHASRTTSLTDGGTVAATAAAAKPPPHHSRASATTTKPNPSEEPTETINSHAIDLGGALIHGIDDNPMYTITTQMGVPLHQISDYCLLLNDRGWPFDPREDEKITTLFNECLDITFQRVEEDKDSQRNFGDLFDEVCKEKGVLPSNPLLKWHQANLELPTGADFHELGYTWNDDEPYGFTGPHAAIETSWKFVMDKLASGLDILLDSPVTRIQTVLPDGSTPLSYPVTIPSKSPTQANSDEAVAADGLPNVEEATELEAPLEMDSGTPPASDAVAAARPPKRVQHKKAPPQQQLIPPLRRSRRVRGEEANVRRSARSTKGRIQMLQIGHDRGSVCYDDPEKKPSSHKRKRKPVNGKQPSIATTATQSDDEGTETDTSVPSSTVQVTLQNGTVLEADSVVCTLPLGILQLPQHDPGSVHFVPPLPRRKRTAFSKLGCGLLNKCAISFPEVFWQDSEFLGMAAKEDSYLVLNATKYTDKPILIFMYGGSFAKKLESRTDTDILEDCLEVLKNICGKEIPAPVDYCVTRWGQELYSRMAFTYIPPGVNGHDELYAAGDAIHDPVLPEKPLIMFAGEHTTPYHPSTMHGAFLSGIREAYRYDIFVAPDLNDNMEFTDDNIYERTFPVRRVVKQSRATQPAQAENKASTATPQVRSRRNRFAGMALRKRPQTPVPLSASSSSSAKNPVSSPEAPGRRSHRLQSGKKIQQVQSPPAPKSGPQVAEEKKRQMDDLEDRILLRSLNSYGRNFSLIRSHILPVFGSKRKRSADQIGKRWELLAARTQCSDVWKKWQASVIAPKPEIIDLFPNGEDGENDDSDPPSRSLRQRARVY